MKRKKEKPTLHFRLVALWFPHQERSSLAIQGVCGVGITQQLRQKHFKDVDHVVHRRPSLVDDVQTNGARAGKILVYATRAFQRRKLFCGCSKGFLQLVDIRVEDSVHEADAGTFVWILVGKLNVDFPKTTREGCCNYMLIC